MTNENVSLDNWDSFSTGSFLKSTDITNEQEAVIVIGADVVADKTTQKPRVQLTLEVKSKQYKYDLNQANMKTLKSAGILAPKAVIGKKLYFKKVLVTSPKTKQEVESLRISRVE